VADLLTHGAAAVLLKAGTRWHFCPVFVLGTFVPDVFSRIPAIVLTWVHLHLVALPPQVLTMWQPLHQPFGLFFLAYLLCLFFDVGQRRLVFWNLVGGMALHLGLDVLQDHHGAGYQLGFPFTDAVWELGIIGSEATVWTAAPLAALAAFVAWRRQAKSPVG